MSAPRTASAPISDQVEWLETDGLGGFASGTTSGLRTRRYHALLLKALTPPTSRVVLVNACEASLDTEHGSLPLSTHRYQPGVEFPGGSSRIVAFSNDPWPTWQFDDGAGTQVRQELLLEHGTGRVVVVWTLVASTGPATLRVRPLMSGRDYHALHHENGNFTFAVEHRSASVWCATYAGLPGVEWRSNGEYRHAPEWYRQFLYTQERERGLDDTEDLASPGEFSWRMSTGDAAMWLMRACDQTPLEPCSADAVVAQTREVMAAERTRRNALGGPRERAADSYLVQRGQGRSVVAGYPWFTDWGRDTFIAMRGLCLATGRRAEARDILVEWAGAVSKGMLPNRFPDAGDEPEFNAVDASLWFVVAAYELVLGEAEGVAVLSAQSRRTLEEAVLGIVSGYAAGTRFGIRMENDGLLAAGVPGVQLTWMDARVGDRVITPRIGKPVEVQALWLNALHAAMQWEPRWREVFYRGRHEFSERFWCETPGHLADVVDVDHMPGTRDATMRPNQILAVGGLPVTLVDGRRARRIVDAVEHDLLTPLGLRSLASCESGYAAQYVGNSAERDAVYHQGTVWPWLCGAFVDAWVKVRGNTRAARAEARRRFLAPLLAHLDDAGLGHVSEIADAAAPFTPRGCPFQAWSVGELLRLERVILREPVRAVRVPASATPVRRAVRRARPS